MYGWIWKTGGSTIIIPHNSSSRKNRKISQDTVFDSYRYITYNSWNFINYGHDAINRVDSIHNSNDKPTFGFLEGKHSQEGI